MINWHALSRLYLYLGDTVENVQAFCIFHSLKYLHFIQIILYSELLDYQC